MPMIDVFATTGTFASKHQLAQDLAKAVMRWEGVPTIPLFLDNTAAFVHERDHGELGGHSVTRKLERDDQHGSNQ